MKKLSVLLVLLYISLCPAVGQKRIIKIPDIPGYITLKCDLHIHTVFSDGNVWPAYRVDEAWKDGLDVLAISDHLEHLPHSEYITTDHNAAYKIAARLAKERNLILIHATEITRSMPPGHLNALFVEDAAVIHADDPFETVENAVEQGAFIQWNHPGWKAQEPDGIPKLYDIHRKLLDKAYIHGIEFFNYTEYYPNILEWCREYNLAVIANSDEHDIISENYGHLTRPMTLVFARERTEESLKEAMFDTRTLAYFYNTLAGREDLLRQVFEASISVGKPFYENERYEWIEIKNNSDMPFHMINGTPGAAEEFTIEANSITTLRIEKENKNPLEWYVKNMLTGYEEYLHVDLEQ
ncbi:MAG: Sb-PDE family phosphodiesterase [Bacteroidales bacterium]|nr:Sb-PDE family phosphodiesterase [Bacteroidales bacterium]